MCGLTRQCLKVIPCTLSAQGTTSDFVCMYLWLKERERVCVNGCECVCVCIYIYVCMYVYICMCMGKMTNSYALTQLLHTGEKKFQSHEVLRYYTKNLVNKA